METRAGYIAVGVFVLALTGALVLFAGWMGAIAIDRELDRYLIFFEGSVTGLAEGSPVRYRGVPVGSVAELGIDSTDVGRVRVVIDVAGGTPILEDSVASLELAGITGGVYVQITGGRQGSRPLRADRYVYPVIPSVPSTLDQVIETTPELLARASAVLQQASAFLSPENQEALTRTLANFEAVSATLADGPVDLGETLERLDGAIGNIDGLVAELRVDVARISDRLDQSLGAVTDDAAAVTASLQQLAQSLTVTADQATALLREVRPGLEDFANTGTYEFTLMVAELRGLAENLSRLAARLEQGPTQFLLGGSNRGVQPER